MHIFLPSSWLVSGTEQDITRSLEQIHTVPAHVHASYPSTCSVCHINILQKYSYKKSRNDVTMVYWDRGRNLATSSAGWHVIKLHRSPRSEYPQNSSPFICRAIVTFSFSVGGCDYRCLRRPSFSPLGASIIFTAISGPRDQLQTRSRGTEFGRIDFCLHGTSHKSSALYTSAMNVIDTRYKCCLYLLHLAPKTEGLNSRPSVKHFIS
jgi:hypothetical protein